MKKLNLNENFISRIWINPAYYGNLHTTDNKPVEILDFGSQNDDSGADFSQCVIRVNDIVYSGDVEIHRTFKDWGLHQHKKDKKYNRVVLQVVFWGEDDRDKNIPPKAARSRNIHTVILSEFLSLSIHDIWKDIINNPSPVFRIPCYPANKDISNEFKSDWVHELGRKRLKYRADRLKSRLEYFEANGYPHTRKTRWEKVLFEYICEALGFSKNKLQFLKLSAEIDFGKMKKHCSSLRDYESVVFGTAGFLENLKIKSDYVSELKACREYLNGKMKFQKMDRAEWMFFRLRPQNFPTLRLAYAAALCREIIENDFLSRIIDSFRNSLRGGKNILKSSGNILSGVKVSDYWKKNYDFGKESKFKYNTLGIERILGIFVNVLVPFVYLYASEFGNTQLLEKSEKIYSELKDSSTNKVLRAMNKQLFFKHTNVAGSQGLIHLHNFYCVRQNCASCRIGRKLSGNESVSDVLQIIIY